MKMMKQSLLLAVFLLTSIFAQAQRFGNTPQDSIKCLESVSIYVEDYKQKNYKAAYGFWKPAVSTCPKYSKNLYIHGVTMMRSFIKKTEDAAKKKELIDSLMWIYDTRIEHFGQEAFVRGRKGSDLLRYRKDDPTLAYYELKKSVDMAQSNSECGIIYAYYNSAFKAAQRNVISKEELIELYLPLSAYINTKVKEVNNAEKQDEKKITRCNKAKNNLDEMFIKIAKCEDIIPIMEKRFDAENIEILRKGIALMTKRNCTDAEIFDKYAKQLHEKDPSHESAYALGAKEFAKGNHSTTAKYFEQAISLCGNCDQAPEYTLATSQCALKRGQLGSAKSLARKAMNLDKSLASKCYSIIANATVKTANSCGDNPIARKSCYWLAYDYAQKAGDSRAMNSYKSNFPSKTELFDYGMLDKVGGSYTVPCLGESTTIRMK